MAKPRPFVPRAGAPIPQRFPALAWRKPAALWAPIALILALGWPAWALMDAPGVMQFALIAGGAAMLAAFVSLGLRWLLGKPPRTRRAVMEHIILAGALSAMIAPFCFSSVLRALAAYEGAGEAAPLPPGMALALLPLCIVLGLPMAYLAGFAFSHVALVKPVKQAHEADPDALRPDPLETYSPSYDDALG